MNLFKKATATLALVTLLSGMFSVGVSASSSTEVDAANALAESGYIVNHSSDTDAYNLNQNVLRQEIAAVARGIAGLEKKTTCDNSFTDVSESTPNTWACYTVEALLDANLIAANTMFNPEREISKAEAIGMMVKASFGDEYSYDASLATSWMEQVVSFAAGKGIVASFTNYDTPATRGFVFEAGYNAEMASNEVVEDCDEVSQLLGLCDEVIDDTTDDTGTGVVISGDNFLAAELSATTPAGTDLPVGANGVRVLAFDVTAGSEDVSITAMELERIGFGESAADAVAIYTDEGRASKVKTFSSSDDMANLTFSPAVVVKAGETRTLTAKVNTHYNIVPSAANLGEFAISVKNITASSTVDAGSIVSNFFDVKAVEAAQLTITDEGVNAAIKAGENQADLAEFRLTNEGNLSTDVDITVTSITLKEIGSVSQTEVLENITLTVGNVVVDTVATMEDKYVTFNFDPIVIADDKNETFKVKADIMGGAGDEVQFTLENVIDITASASKYNAVNIKGTFAPLAVSIDAGELTLYAIDAVSDEIRSDKTNVVLGQLKVVNVAGQNLELQTLNIELVSGSATTIAALVENVEFEVNGTSYDLNADAGTTTVAFSDTDLNVVLPQGTTLITIRADTLANLADGETITMGLDASTSATFRVEETADDVVVTDITPASLSWDKVTVVNSAATVSNVPLANVAVVKGAQNIVALQFEIEAGKASYVTTDRIKAKLANLTYNGTALTKATISEVALYKGSVSDSNLLDKVSGSKLDTNGVATFDGFEVKIAADATQTFIVTVSTVDTTAVVGKVIVASVVSTDISVEDDDNDVVTLNAITLYDKEISILDAGILTLTADANNDDNENPKTILAGNEAIVYSIDAIATNEKVSADTVKFTFNTDLKKVIASAKLYYGSTVVATAANSKVLTVGATTGNKVAVNAAVALIPASTSTNGNQVAVDAAVALIPAATGSNAAAVIAAIAAIPASTGTDGNFAAVDAAIAAVPTATDDTSAGSTVTFDNISNLNFATSSEELKLAIVTENIGFEKIGQTVTAVKVTNLAITDAEGVSSGETVTVAPVTTGADANLFAVVPATVIASVVQTLDSGSVKVKVTVNTGNNTATTNAAAPTVTIQGLGVKDLVTGAALADFKIYEEGKSVVLNEGTLGIIVSGSKTFDLVPTVTTNVTYTLRLPKDGIKYDAAAALGLKSNLNNELDLGAKTYPN